MSAALVAAAAPTTVDAPGIEERGMEEKVPTIGVPDAAAEAADVAVAAVVSDEDAAAALSVDEAAAALVEVAAVYEQ